MELLGAISGRGLCIMKIKDVREDKMKVKALCLMLFLILFLSSHPFSLMAEESDSLNATSKNLKTPLPEKLTLNQAIAIGLKESPLLASKENLVSASKERVKASKGLLLPRIDAYSSYKRLSDPQLVVPMKSFESKNSATFSRDQYGLGITVKIPVFEGGRLWTGVTLSELSRAITEEELRLTRQELIYNITNVFNQILFLKELESAQVETLKALKKLREDAKTRLSVGRIAPVDLMRIDTQVSEEEDALTATREEKVRALETLAQLIGREPGEVKDVTGRLKEHDIKGLYGSEEELKSLILSRPDIKRAKKEMELAQKTIRYEKGLHLPRLDLVGDYGRRAGSGFDGDEEVWSAGVVLGINIFSGGVISARVREAEAKYLAARNRYEHLRLTAYKEVKNAISRIIEAKKRIKAARSALKSSRESFRIERLKYETGAGTVTDSLLSQAAWLRSKAQVARALFDSERAMMDFKLATGRVE